MSIRTISIIGLAMFASVLLAGQCIAASPPYIKEGAPTEITFEEDGSYLDLNLSDVFADDDPEDEQLDLTNVEVEGLDISINQTTGLVNISGEEDWNGQVEVVFRAMDGRGYFADHEVTVIVLPVNDRPDPVGKINRRSWNEGDDHFINVSHYFTDVDGDQLFYYAIIEPDAYTCVNTDGDPRNPMFDLICQDPNFYGYLQVVFTAYDKDPAVHPDEALSTTQTAIFEVKGHCKPPEVVEWYPKAATITINETESQVFTVPQDLIYDVDSTSFKWYWFVNDVEMEDATGESFRYPIEPGYQDEGTYTIRCEIKDNLGEPALVSPSWTLHVIDINLLPSADLVVEQAMIPFGDIIILAAVGSDMDGDDLTYRWYRLTEDERAKGIGDGDSFVYKTDLPPGRHYFRCEVSDGKSTAETDWMLVTVEEVETPGPSGMLAMMAILIASLALAASSRRRGGHSKAY